MPRRKASNPRRAPGHAPPPPPHPPPPRQQSFLDPLSDEEEGARRAAAAAAPPEVSPWRVAGEGAAGGALHALAVVARLDSARGGGRLVCSRAYAAEGLPACRWALAEGLGAAEDLSAPIRCFFAAGDALGDALGELVAQGVAHASREDGGVRVRLLQAALAPPARGFAARGATGLARRRREAMLRVLAALDPGGVPAWAADALHRPQRAFDAAALQALVSRSHDLPELAGSFPELRPTLRPYQLRAVRWMVQRELGEDADGGDGADEPLACTRPEWRRLGDASLWVSLQTGVLTREDPCAAASDAKLCGGCLCDEMGLGKTVEMLALLMAHPRPGAPGRASRAALVRQAETAALRTSAIKREDRVFCVCGASDGYDPIGGRMVQCHTCLAWHHTKCAGFTVRRKRPGTNTRAPKRQRMGDSVGVAAESGASGGGAQPEESVANGIGASAAALTKVQGWEYSDDEDDDNRHAFVCNDCQVALAGYTPTFATGATLIVCPPTILGQWRREIEKHTAPGALRVEVYAGASARERNCDNGASAARLACADIVLTTYDVLRKDLYHDDAKGRIGSSRAAANEYGSYRGKPIPSPLTRVDWWRVVLDEAQMVEGLSNATKMARRLRAHIRWCVTGTPVSSRGLEDLADLAAFLHAAPMDDPAAWRWVERAYACGEMAPLRRFARSVMWRSTKAEVESELQLPAQSENREMVCFSAVERHFYDSQQKECFSKLATDLRRGKINLQLSHMPQLLRLRQACDHPQVGEHGIGRGTAEQRLGGGAEPMSMEQVLDVMVSKARVEAEDSLRDVIACLNGLAGLALLSTEPGSRRSAVDCYREALKLGDEYANDRALRVHTDKLQQLHSLHNLAEALDGDGAAPLEADIPRTLRDSKLREEAEALRAQVSSERSNALGIKMLEHKAEADKAARLRREAINAGDMSASSWQPAWWVEALDYAKTTLGDSDCVARVRQYLESSRQMGADVERTGATTDHRSLFSFKDYDACAGLQYVLSTELDALEAARLKYVRVRDALAKAAKHPSHEITHKAGQCIFCRPPEYSANQDLIIPDKPELCLHCAEMRVLRTYEARLFDVRSYPKQRGTKLSVTDCVSKLLYSSKLSHHDTIDTKGVIADLVGAQHELVGHAQIYAKASDSERVLKFLVKHLTDQLKKIKDGKLKMEQLLLPLERLQLLKAAGERHLGVLQALRAEFLKSRPMLEAGRNMLHTMDELRQSSMRMQLRDPSLEAVSEYGALYMVSAGELAARNVTASNELSVHKAVLKHSTSQLRYLTGLAAKGAAAEEKRECPICQENDLAGDVGVLVCGHIMCYECCRKLVNRANKGQQRALDKGRDPRPIQCPTCRRSCGVADVRIVQKSGNSNGSSEKGGRAGPMAGAADSASVAVGNNVGDGASSVRGSYGAKITAIVRRIIKVFADDAGAKVLVFSEWETVLKLVEHALKTNEVLAARIKGVRSYERELEAFRTSVGGAGPRVLLLPLKHGAQGLTLIEANHVVLVEPCLNPGTEAQAINRVHRIGQTRPTFVHHFLVEKSVEISIEALKIKRRNAAAVAAGGAGADGGGPLSLGSPSKRSRHEGEALTEAELRAVIGGKVTNGEG